MKHIIISFFFMFFGAAALAQDHTYPALFNVSGVAHGDVLNVRAGPGVSHDIIGSLARNATGIEVVGTNQERTWARVSFGEFSGWASMRFLARTSPSWNAGLPTPLYCYGTEPFWSYERLIGGGNWSDFETPGEPYAELFVGHPAARGPNSFAMDLDSGSSTITAFLRRGICSDGMSDRDYGIIAQFLRRSGGQTVLYDGCCSLVR